MNVKEELIAIKKIKNKVERKKRHDALLAHIEQAKGKDKDILSKELAEYGDEFLGNLEKELSQIKETLSFSKNGQ